MKNALKIIISALSFQSINKSARMFFIKTTKPGHQHIAASDYCLKLLVLPLVILDTSYITL
jgi:hypothetical protein